MYGGYLNVDRQGCGPAAQALGADAQGVDPLQQLLLHFGVEGVGVGGPGRAKKGPLGQLRRAVKAAANAHAHHNGRTGVGACFCHGLNHKVFDSLGPIGGAEHGNAAHILATGAFRGHGDLQPVAGHQTDVQDGGGVVLGVYPAQGVRHHGAPEACFQIALVDACIDRLLQVSLDVDLLADFEEDAGDACVLADRQLVLLGNFIIFYDLGQNTASRFPRLPLLTLGDTGPHVLG